ncbi:MAG: transporter substrate-binding domain-containing protein [Clostridiales bacterium]|nr:transporter substrate-binding domain-containing protein [Clostridiales bacterium]
MKKIMTFVLAMVLSVVAVFAFTGCGEAKKKLVVYTEIELTAETYAFAINKSNTELKEDVNAILADLKENGELDEIINSFFDGNAEFTYTNPSAPTASNRANYFVVGTNAYFPPFEHYEGNKLSGIDMQIASIIATELGKTLYIKDMEFDSLVPAVEIGEVDIAMAGMTVNEERLKVVDFTDGYYTSAQVITVVEGDDTFADCKTAEDVENILKSKGSNYKIGTQNGTTGYMYSAGDEGFGYDGFKNLTTKGYTTGALAMQDLRNGKLNAVILDKQPSIMITKSMNK